MASKAQQQLPTSRENVDLALQSLQVQLGELTSSTQRVYEKLGDHIFCLKPRGKVIRNVKRHARDLCAQTNRECPDIFREEGPVGRDWSGEEEDDSLHLSSDDSLGLDNNIGTTTQARPKNSSSSTKEPDAAKTSDSGSGNTVKTPATTQQKIISPSGDDKSDSGATKKQTTSQKQKRQKQRARFNPWAKKKQQQKGKSKAAAKTKTKVSADMQTAKGGTESSGTTKNTAVAQDAGGGSKVDKKMPVPEPEGGEGGSAQSMKLFKDLSDDLDAAALEHNIPNKFRNRG